MRILSRYVFREIFISSLLGTVLATFVTFLQEADRLSGLTVSGKLFFPSLASMMDTKLVASDYSSKGQLIWP